MDLSLIYVYVSREFLYYLVVYSTKQHMKSKLNFGRKFVIMFINIGNIFMKLGFQVNLTRSRRGLASIYRDTGVWLETFVEGSQDWALG